jgi:hypothetical protein
MTKSGLKLATATCLAALAGAAQAQVPALVNGSFESPALCVPSKPNGWRYYNTATWHSLNRTLAPGSQLMPAGVTPHDGSGLIKLGTGVDFAGVETEDRLYSGPIQVCFDPDTYPPENFPYPWPSYTYQPQLDGDPANDMECQLVGGGTTPHGPDPINIAAGAPIVASGWYMIPAATPLVGTKAGLKVNFKSDFVTYPGQLGAWHVREDLTIDGTVPGGVHTNGQWVKFTMTIPQSEFPDPTSCWTPGIGQTGYVSIVALHFAGSGNTANSGVIYWDDLQFTQGSPPCPGDHNGSGSVDADDLFAFLDDWFAQNGVCTSSCSANYTSPPAVDADDLFAYLDLWFANNGNVCP